MTRSASAPGKNVTFESDDWQRLWRQSARLRKAVHRSIYRYLRQYVAVEDILGETIRYTREHPEQWRHIPDERLFFYLRRLSNLLILEQARRFRIHREIPTGNTLRFPEGGSDPARGNPSPAALLHRGEKQQAIERILGRLKNDSHREVLHLVWLEGLPVTQAAERLGRSPEAVQMLLGRAFRACRSIARRESFRGFRVSGETR